MYYAVDIVADLAPCRWAKRNFANSKVDTNAQQVGAVMNSASPLQKKRLALLNQRVKIPYNPNNAQHAEVLIALGNLAFGDQFRSAPLAVICCTIHPFRVVVLLPLVCSVDEAISPKWKNIGFQGNGAPISFLHRARLD